MSSLLPNYKVPKCLRSVLSPYNIILSPLKSRPPFESELKPPNFLLTFFLFFHSKNIPLISNLFDILIFPFLLLFNYLFNTHFTIHSFQLTPFSSKHSLIPLFLTPSNKKAKKTLKKNLFLFLAFQAISPDELWQVLVSLESDSWKFRSHLFSLLLRSHESQLLSFSFCKAKCQQLKFCYTSYSVQQVLLQVTQEILKENHKSLPFKPKIEEVFFSYQKTQTKIWIDSLRSLKGKFFSLTTSRSILYDYKTGFLSWLLLNHQFCAVKSWMCLKLEQKFDKFWIPLVGKTKPWDCVDLTNLPEVTCIAATSKIGKGTYSSFESLQKNYENWSIFPFFPVEDCDTIFRFLSCGKLTGVSIWMYGINRESQFLISLIIKCSKIHIFLQGWKIRQVLNDLISRLENQGKKVDLLLSFLFPSNEVIQKIAREKKIPFIICPTDLACSSYFDFNPVDDNIYLRLPITEYIYFIRGKFRNFLLRPGQILAGGYLLKDYKAEKESLRQILETETQQLDDGQTNFLDPELSVLYKSKLRILIAAGSCGALTILKYADRLIESGPRLMQITIVTGKNQVLFKKLKKKYKPFVFSNDISVTVLSYTEKFLQLLENSDVFLTKPGGASVFEAWKFVKTGRLFLIRPFSLVEFGNFILTKDFAFGHLVNNPEEFAEMMNNISNFPVLAVNEKQKVILEPSFDVQFSFYKMVEKVLNVGS